MNLYTDHPAGSVVYAPGGNTYTVETDADCGCSLLRDVADADRAILLASGFTADHAGHDATTDDAPRTTVSVAPVGASLDVQDAAAPPTILSQSLTTPEPPTPAAPESALHRDEELFSPTDTPREGDDTAQA